MKLVRFGAPGREKPGIIDDKGRIRDLSKVVPDIAGETLSPKEAGTRLTNVIKNKTENPDYKSPDERLAAVEQAVARLQDDVAHLLDVQGGTVVGPG